MDYTIIKKIAIGLAIILPFGIIIHLKEELKVPTKCDFDECFTNLNLNLEEDYLGPGPGPGPNPPRSPISNPLPLSRLV